MKTVGLIGFGSFGSFIYDELSRHEELSVYVYDPYKNRVDCTIEEMGKLDIIILAIPLEEYGPILTSLAPHLNKDALIVDVCSVKLMPAKIIKKHLPGHANFLLTHPLFGPRSASKTLKGHTLIVCEKMGESADVALKFVNTKLGINLYHCTADEHDKAMAQVHALTFFIAKSLEETEDCDSVFLTPSYRMIMELREFSKGHSSQLFNTIQNGNPYASEIRQKLINNFTEIDNSIKERNCSHEK